MQSHTDSKTASTSEPAEITTLVERLSERFGQEIAVQQIRDVVTEEYDQLQDRARIQQYVPLLAQHSADRRLRPVARQDHKAA